MSMTVTNIMAKITQSIRRCISQAKIYNKVTQTMTQTADVGLERASGHNKIRFGGHINHLTIAIQL